MKMAKNGQFLHQPDTPTLRHRSARLGVELRLGGPKPRFMHLFGPLRRSNAPPRRRRSSALPRRTCKSGFGSSFPIILTIIHWTNKDHNK